MRGVDLERDDLFYFKADEAIREVVLGNDEPGSNDPFLGDLFLLDEEGFLMSRKKMPGECAT